MKLALISDIHGNSVALDAVLADIAAQEAVEQIWVLGDLVALGPDPRGALEQLSRLDSAHFIRGNTENYVCRSELPIPNRETVLRDPENLTLFERLARSFGWTQGIVADAGWLDWLSELPLELRMTLPDGSRLLGVHASPGKEDGGGLRPGYTKEEWDELLSGCDADIVCVGHTHWAMDERIAGIHILNLGSVSNPQMADRRASYVVLEADENGYQARHRQVAYDYQAVIDDLQQKRHPSADHICALLRGEIRPAWLKEPD